ncbi:MAG: lipoyl(octanoyl) transferase LipB [Gammaproteobacteria bacterium]|nr:lipoyl(octanoyl) transferase LipB [Gammaproteobacteria bacterium]
MTNNIIIKNLGLCDYHQTWLKMQEFTLNRNSSTPDEIWLLEHPPVFTQGMAGKPEHVLNPKEIPIVQTDRGGQVTYHGPGQLVCYLLFDLRRLKLGVKKFVFLLENTVIQLLAEYKIEASTRKDAPGVYVKQKKICSIGLRIRRGCSYHGIALNINNDLEPFTRINPCGFLDLSMTKISDFASPTIDEIGKTLCKLLVKNLAPSK